MEREKIDKILTCLNTLSESDSDAKIQQALNTLCEITGKPKISIKDIEEKEDSDPTFDLDIQIIKPFISFVEESLDLTDEDYFYGNLDEDFIYLIDNDKKKLDLLDKMSRTNKLYTAQSMKTDFYKVEALSKLSDDYSRASIIETIQDDSIKVEALNYINEEYIKLKIAIAIRDNNEKIKACKNFDNEEYKAEILKTIADDDKKIEGCEVLKNEFKKADVMRTIQDDDKKIVAAKILQYDTYKALVLETIHDDDKKVRASTDIVDDSSKLEVLLSIQDDDKKIEAVGTLSNDFKRLQLLETLQTDSKKLKALDMLTEFNRVFLIRNMQQANIQLEAIAKVENPSFRIDAIEAIKEDKTILEALLKYSYDTNSSASKKYSPGTLAYFEDTKVKLIKELRLNVEEVKDVIGRVYSLNKHQKELLGALYQKNDELLTTMDIRILDEKYSDLEDKLSIITSYKDIQQKILGLDDKTYEIFIQML